MRHHYGSSSVSILPAPGWSKSIEGNARRKRSPSSWIARSASVSGGGKSQILMLALSNNNQSAKRRHRRWSTRSFMLEGSTSDWKALQRSSRSIALLTRPLCSGNSAIRRNDSLRCAIVGRIGSGRNLSISSQHRNRGASAQRKAAPGGPGAAATSFKLLASCPCTRCRSGKR